MQSYSFSSKSFDLYNTIISLCPESNCILIHENNIIYKNEKNYIQNKFKKGHNDEILLNDYLIKSKSK